MAGTTLPGWKLVQMVLHLMRRYSKTVAWRKAIEQRVIGLPPPHHLPDDDRDTPYFFVGDDAFPRHTYMMKPYGRLGLEVPERIYNYWTSCCRIVCANAFGILANRYACLLSVIKFQPNMATNIVLAAICCHNLMREISCDPECRYGTWGWQQQRDSRWMAKKEHMEKELQHIHGYRETKAGKQLREYLKHYYTSAAREVPWQHDII